MAAMKRHRDRTRCGQLLEADHPAGVVGQHEGRHRIARLRRLLAGTVLPQPLDQPVNGGREVGPPLAQ